MLGILEGIVVAIVVTLVTLFIQVEYPPVYALGRKPGTDVFRPLVNHSHDETFPGLLIVRTEGRLFFANIARVIDELSTMAHRSPTQVVLLDCGAIPDIEYTALKALVEFDEQLQKAGSELWLARLNRDALHMIQNSPIGGKMADGRTYLNAQQAVNAYVQLSDRVRHGQPSDSTTRQDQKTVR